MGSIIKKNQRSTISCYCTFNEGLVLVQYTRYNGDHKNVAEGIILILPDKICTLSKIFPCGVCSICLRSKHLRRDMSTFLVCIYGETGVFSNIMARLVQVVSNYGGICLRSKHLQCDLPTQKASTTQYSMSMQLASTARYFHVVSFYGVICLKIQKHMYKSCCFFFISECDTSIAV